MQYELDEQEKAMMLGIDDADKGLPPRTSERWYQIGYEKIWPEILTEIQPNGKYRWREDAE